MELLVINLARAEDRWNIVREKAAEHGFDIRRIEGIDGALVAPRDWIDTDRAAFLKNHGRFVLPGEYGCYQSHLRALRAVTEAGMPHAVIMEDDVVPDHLTQARLQAIVEALPHFDVAKLMNHRTKGFVTKVRTARGDRLGRTLHGPQGSAAAYLVSQAGARKLLQTLTRMELPWDVALERYWATGVTFYSVKENLFQFTYQNRHSLISSQGYDKTKQPAWKRLPTFIFRTKDYFYRSFHALAG